MEQLEIDHQHAGRRLDNVLLNQLKGAPRSLVYKLVRSGQVRVNGRRARPHQRLEAGDVVRIPPRGDAGSNAGPAAIPVSRTEALQARVLHEDDHYLVIDKPAGLASHAGSGLHYGAIEIMRAARPEIERLDLAHRLDRETSGCLLMCKDLASLKAANAAIADRASSKFYRALLRGRPAAGLESIDASLDTVRVRGERHVRAGKQGKHARTVIELRTPVGPHTLVELRLITGRMHQIRAHARHIGHPVAGDPRYGDAAFNEAMAGLGLERLFLHAARLRLELPNHVLDVEAPLPRELTAVLDNLHT